MKMTNNTPDYKDNLYFEDYVSGIKVERSDKLIKENAQLKELLKEWVQFEIEENPNDFTVMSERMSELANKTKEALKCQE